MDMNHHGGHSLLTAFLLTAISWLLKLIDLQTVSEVAAFVLLIAQGAAALIGAYAGWLTIKEKLKEKYG